MSGEDEKKPSRKRRADDDELGLIQSNKRIHLEIRRQLPLFLSARIPSTLLAHAIDFLSPDDFGALLVAVQRGIRDPVLLASALDSIRLMLTHRAVLDLNERDFDRMYEPWLRDMLVNMSASVSVLRLHYPRLTQLEWNFLVARMPLQSFHLKTRHAHPDVAFYVHGLAQRSSLRVLNLHIPYSHTPWTEILEMRARLTDLHLKALNVANPSDMKNLVRKQPELQVLSIAVADVQKTLETLSDMTTLQTVFLYPSLTEVDYVWPLGDAFIRLVQNNLLLRKLNFHYGDCGYRRNPRTGVASFLINQFSLSQTDFTRIIAQLPRQWDKLHVAVPDYLQALDFLLDAIERKHCSLRQCVFRDIDSQVSLQNGQFVTAKQAERAVFHFQSFDLFAKTEQGIHGGVVGFRHARYKSRPQWVQLHVGYSFLSAAQAFLMHTPLQIDECVIESVRWEDHIHDYVQSLLALCEWIRQTQKRIRRLTVGQKMHNQSDRTQARTFDAPRQWLIRPEWTPEFTMDWFRALPTWQILDLDLFTLNWTSELRMFWIRNVDTRHLLRLALNLRGYVVRQWLATLGPSLRRLELHASPIYWDDDNDEKKNQKVEQSMDLVNARDWMDFLLRNPDLKYVVWNVHPSLVTLGESLFQKDWTHKNLTSVILTIATRLLAVEDVLDFLKHCPNLRILHIRCSESTIQDRYLVCPTAKETASFRLRIQTEFPHLDLTVQDFDQFPFETSVRTPFSETDSINERWPVPNLWTRSFELASFYSTIRLPILPAEHQSVFAQESKDPNRWAKKMGSIDPLLKYLEKITYLQQRQLASSETKTTAAVAISFVIPFEDEKPVSSSMRSTTDEIKLALDAKPLSARFVYWISNAAAYEPASLYWLDRKTHELEIYESEDEGWMAPVGGRGRYINRRVLSVGGGDTVVTVVPQTEYQPEFSYPMEQSRAYVPMRFVLYLHLRMMNPDTPRRLLIQEALFKDVTWLTRYTDWLYRTPGKKGQINTELEVKSASASALSYSSSVRYLRSSTLGQYPFNDTRFDPGSVKHHWPWPRRSKWISRSSVEKSRVRLTMQQAKNLVRNWTREIVDETLLSDRKNTEEEMELPRQLRQWQSKSTWTVQNQRTHPVFFRAQVNEWTAHQKHQQSITLRCPARKSKTVLIQSISHEWIPQTRCHVLTLVLSTKDLQKRKALVAVIRRLARKLKWQNLVVLIH